MFRFGWFEVNVRCYRKVRLGFDHLGKEQELWAALTEHVDLQQQISLIPRIVGKAACEQLVLQPR
jgi:hypothetical protein